ncbi:L-seryl-tRNA(Sec) selenium transferase [Dictyobacter sp. S3.2.2.5]|uniref:L-seryl-tRNA(Sec) selenium transferase n=1 Tax=Dictyobacter halimunensis TaxID=3026934 RepID=A0ABQ6G0U4_9CHLR|nr:L-seryl-tRNA(Sec) selenium transferase [Dictyobacter sp. S3.2.2.5]
MSLNQNQFRLLPSVDELLHTSQGMALARTFSHDLVVSALRLSVSQARDAIRAGSPCPSAESLLLAAELHLQQQFQPRLRPLINATGVIINTNLGRAPLSQDALQAVQRIAGGYSNLEYDIDLGVRGSRHTHVGALLRELTGAEAALVTNNNAAAVLLGLSALAAGHEVVISRGQLVEIGGGFRVPDVMRQSGCQLVEVGTTNRTRIADYAAALTDRTAVLLSVHPSNFLITGFTESTSIASLAELAHERGLLVMDDLGSGCLLNCEQYGLSHEPTPQESLAAGADLVCFSGDKLLGGPQAGIILGKAEVVARVARHPLMRAVRIDKMTLAALETTLRHYQLGEAETRIPIWRMISTPAEKVARRAADWAHQLTAQGLAVHTQPGQSTIGGGSLPGETLSTTLLALDAASCSLPLETISQRLRTRHTPIISRISRDTLYLDPRTVLEEQDVEVIAALQAVLA